MGVIYGLNRYVPLKRLFVSPTLEQGKKKSVSWREVYFILTLNRHFITEPVTGTGFLFILEIRYRNQRRSAVRIREKREREKYDKKKRKQKKK